MTTPDFVACHVPSYVDKYDVLKGLKPGGSFLLNSVHDAETTCRTLPDHMKVFLAKNKINFYIINATKIAAELGLGSRTNTIMQAAFFKIANVIPFEKAVEEMKKAIYKSYGKKGEDIVNMNYAAVDAGGNAVVKVEVPAEWTNIELKPADHGRGYARPEFVRNIVDPINASREICCPCRHSTDVKMVRGRTEPLHGRSAASPSMSPNGRSISVSSATSARTFVRTL